MFAIDSYFENDYTNTFLYCGMTCEVALGLSCDIAYNEAMLNYKEGKSQNLRIIEVTTASGVSYKDPIYDTLRNAGFSSKLKNLVLYAKNKSLMVDDDRLFKSIDKIYSTRNKIVHVGSTKESDKAYEINAENALEAIERVNKFIEWLGLEGGFPSPELVNGKLEWVRT